MKIDNSRSFDVLCMGRVAVDLYAEQVHCPLSEVESFKKYLGGSAGNIAIGCARQGLKSALLSCVGMDAMGDFLLNTLIDEGVDTSLIQRSSNHLTALVLLGIEPPDKFPLMFYRENCADMQVDASGLEQSDIAKAKTLVVTATRLSQEGSRRATHRVLQLAKDSNTPVVLDLDYRPVLWNLTEKGDGESRFKESLAVSQHYQDILAHCQLIVGTEEEFKIAGGASQLSQALENVRALSQADCVIKRGDKGCDILSGDLSIKGAAYNVEVLNVLGAGDAFLSGLLGQLLKGESWARAAQFANACGAIVVTRHGCAPAIPSLSETRQFLSEVE